MNGIFSVIVIAGIAVLTFTAPELIMPTLNGSAQKSIELSATLLVVYSVWLGVFELIESGGISRLLADFLKKPVRFLFGETSQASQKYICMNLSANILGLGGVATPMGIKACSLLEEEQNLYAQNTLFVFAASSLQIIPTSVISLRASLGSASPESVILPTVFCSLISLISSILLLKVFNKP